MDRRVKRTRRLLGKALIDLLQENNFNAISIRDITDKADIAYSTFFRNFERKEDLLLAYLRDFLDKITQLMMIQEGNTFREQTRQYMRVLFQELENSPKMCHVLLKTPAVQPILKKFQAELAQHNVQVFETMSLTQSKDSPPLDLIFHNGMVQLFGLIEWWLDHNFEPTVEKILDYYEILVMQTKWRLAIGPDAMEILLDS